MHLYDLIDADETRALIDGGFLNEQFHPTEALAILNYSKRAVPGHVCWEVESLHHCRGLIYNTTTGEIVARPFKKFWNYGERGAAKIPLNARVEVLDKIDGSLGIMYPSARGGFAIATRGSFTSDQAVHATAVLRERYADFTPDTDWTMLFEIVYPENRIVLDYGRTDDLVLLGGAWNREPEDNARLGPDSFPEWKGPRTELIFEGTFADALNLPRDRQNAEGYVIRRTQNDDMLKVKQADYVELHRIVTGLSEKTVWKHLRDGKPVSELLDAVPEEFESWILDVAGRILGDAIRIQLAADREYNAILENVDWSAVALDSSDADVRRAQAKAFAAEVAKLDSKHKWALFLLFNGKGDQIRQVLLDKHLEPVGKVTPATAGS